jgi:hypothetical protein
MPQRICCKVGCEKPALFEIWYMPSPDPYSSTDACQEHVGDLMTDKNEHHIYRITQEDK